MTAAGEGESGRQDAGAPLPDDAGSRAQDVPGDPQGADGLDGGWLDRDGLDGGRQSADAPSSGGSPGFSGRRFAFSSGGGAAGPMGPAAYSGRPGASPQDDDAIPMPDEVLAAQDGSEEGEGDASPPVSLSEDLAPAEEVEPPTLAAMPDGRPSDATPEAAPPPGGKPRRRPAPRKRHRTGLGGRLFLLALVVAVIFGGYALIGKTIRLPVWAVAEIEARINTALAPALPDSAVAIGAVEVGVEEDWVPRLRLEDLRLLKPNGDALLALPDLRVELDPAAILSGKFRARDLRVIGARVAVRRDREGHFDLAFGTGQGLPRIDSFAQIFDLADRIFATPAAASLRGIEAEALTLSLRDERTGRNWEVGDGRFRLDNRPEQLAAELGLSLVGDSAAVPVPAPATAVLTLVTEKGRDSARFSAAIENIAAQDLASQSAPLAPFGVLDAPISGRLAATLGNDGIEALEGQLQIAAGALRPTPAAAPIPFDRASLSLGYDAPTGRVLLSGLSVESPSLRVKAEGQTYLMRADGSHISGALAGELPAAFLSQIRFTQVMVDPEGLFQEPVRFSDGALDLRLRLDPFSLEIGQLSLAEEARRLTARGRIGADAEGWSGSVDLDLNEIAHDRLIALWPVTLLPRTRDWLGRNLLKGTLFDVKAALRIAPGTDPRLHLGYSFSDADVRFIATLPPIQDGYGYSTIDGQTYTVVMTRGRVTPPEGGAIDVSGSVFKVADITRKPAIADVTLHTASSLTAALSLLDQPPFNFMTKADKPVDLGQGQARIDTTLRLPLQKKILLSDVDYSVSGRVTGFRSDVLVPGRVITAQEMAVAATPEGLRITGPGRIGAVPFDVTYTQGFAPAQRGKARIEGSVELSQKTAEEFGLGLPRGMVSGSGRGQVEIDLVKGQPGELHLRSGLGGIGLAIPELGWAKPAAASGKLEAQVRLGQPAKVERLALSASGLEAEGSVTMRSGGGLEVARFGKVKLDGWLDGSVSITGRGAGRSVALAMTGGTVDMRKMPGPEQRRSGGGGTGGSGGPLDLAIDRLIVSRGISLTAFRGGFSLAGGISGDFSARVNGLTKVRGTVVPARSGTSVRLLSEDAGATLAAAGLFSSARGGTLDLQLVPRAKSGQYDGRARLKNIRVRNASVLAELLNAISVVGILEQLNGEGLVFNEAEADFLLTPQAVQITHGSATGASLGVSMAGVYQSGSGQLSMQGVVSPVYLLNGIGSVVTRRGEGVFGFNYSLRGTADNPQVDVNPLSILTPGMFREIFRSAPPVLGERPAGE